MAVASTTSVGELERFIEAQLGPFKVPGVAVAVMRGEDVLLSLGFGTRSVALQLLMTTETVTPT